jgi:drug/metabolite transporter (DMT)-like permease
MPRLLAVALLLLATAFWGFAFVAQKWAMGSMGPLTYSGSRFILAGVLILPFGIAELRRRNVPLTRNQWALVALVSGALFLGSWLQQVGIGMTTVTNTGFLTALYVLLVPILGLALGQKPHPMLLAGVPMALLGVFLLNGGGLDRLGLGDLLVIGCAAVFAVHVLSLGAASAALRLPFFISAVSFLAAGVLSLAGAFAWEAPTLEGVLGGWQLIAYTGIFSTAIGFSIQAVCQQYLPPANTAIILSAEGLFAALGGALLLNERLTLIGYTGAALIFAAIVLVEAAPLLRRKATTA